MSTSPLLLSTADLIFMAFTLTFTLECRREQERRAFRIGAFGVLTAMVFAVGILWLRWTTDRRAVEEIVATRGSKRP